jgi:hypothetical protein
MKTNEYTLAAMAKKDTRQAKTYNSGDPPLVAHRTPIRVRQRVTSKLQARLYRNVDALHLDFLPQYPPFACLGPPFSGPFAPRARFARVSACKLLSSDLG